jgi:DNA-binding beta-propeller fold protein YncE
MKKLSWWSGLTLPATSQAGLVAVLFLILSLLTGSFGPVKAETSQYFPETGKTVSGKFLEYWQINGGLAIYGYPITEAKMEVDPETGKTFLTQWFERNRFELHPENTGTKNEVLLGLLGKDLKREALEVDSDFVRAEPLFNPYVPREEQLYFTQTGHNLRYRFLDFWQQNGGLERFGYPISEPYREVEPETQQDYLVQWFERARFEYHPENKPPYDVLLGLIGKQLIQPRPQNLDILWKIGGNYSVFEVPHGVIVDKKSTLLFTTEINNDSYVYSFTPEGYLIEKWDIKGLTGRFFTVNAVTTDHNNNVYMADHTKGRILKFDRWGRLQLEWSLGKNIYEMKMAADSQNNLYVLDRSSILKFDTQGKLLLKWPILGDDGNALELVAGIVIDHADNIYIAGHTNPKTGDPETRVVKFDSQGNFLLKWGSIGTGEGQFSRGDLGLAEGEPGVIYVFDSGTGFLNKFDEHGKFITKWPTEKRGDFAGADEKGNVYFFAWQKPLTIYDSAGKLLKETKLILDTRLRFQPHCLDLAPDGSLYTTDFETGRILKFDTKGRFLLAWTIEANSKGEIGYITGVTVDSQNNVYAADGQYNNIQKFDSAGHFILSWSIKHAEESEESENFVKLAADSQGNIYLISRNPFSQNPLSRTYSSEVRKYSSEGKFLTSWAVSESILIDLTVRKDCAVRQ